MNPFWEGGEWETDGMKAGGKAYLLCQKVCFELWGQPRSQAEELRILSNRLTGEKLKF